MTARTRWPWFIASLSLLFFGGTWAQEDPRGPFWPIGPFYRTDFGEPAVIGEWAITSGVWEIRSGVLQQRDATRSARIATVPAYRFGEDPDTGHNFYLDAYASIRSKIPEARVGVVFNYADSANYYEATFSASGDVRLVTRCNGVSTTVATGSFKFPGINKWTHIRIERGHGMTTVKLDGVPVIRALQQELAPGDVGFTSSMTVAYFDDLAAYTLSMLPRAEATYVEDFEDRFADFWTAERGTWNVTSGYYQNTGVSIAEIALSDIRQVLGLGNERDILYTIKVRMLNRYGARGNLMGLIVDYANSDNYTEVLFSPTGQAHINVVENGVRRTLQTTPYSGGGPNRWFEVELVQQLIFDGPDTSYVKVNGQVVFNNVPSGIFRGVVTHWTLGRFDDFRASVRVFRPSFHSFDSDDIPIQEGWQVRNGALNGFAIQSSSNYALPQTWHEMHDVSIRAWINNHYGSSGNRAGIMYGGRDNDNFFDFDDYHEVIFSPTGVAYLNRVLHGEAINIATAPYKGGGAHRWFNVQILRRNGYTTVRVNGETIFNEVYQPDASGEYIGPVTHWTNVSFDDFSITELTQ